MNVPNATPAPFPYLRLIRIWNLPTALADVYAGFVLAGAAAAGGSSARLLLLFGTSAAIYSAGMAWNDILDLKRDRTLHADRPLPSGAMRKGTAVLLASALVALGLLGGSWLGGRAFAVTAVLVVCTFTYNARLKHKGLIGCLNMGACRFLNMWLGIAAAGGSIAGLWGYPATLGLYVAAVTLVSLQEENRITRGKFIGIASLMLVAILPFAVLCAFSGDGEGPSPAALLPLAVMVLWMAAATVPAVRVLTGRAIGGLIRTSLTCIILLDAAMLLSAHKTSEGIMCSLLIIPSLMLARSVARRPAPAQSAAPPAAAPSEQPAPAPSSAPPTASV